MEAMNCEYTDGRALDSVFDFSLSNDNERAVC